MSQCKLPLTKNEINAFVDAVLDAVVVYRLRAKELDGWIEKYPGSEVFKNSKEECQLCLKNLESLYGKLFKLNG